MDQVEEDVALLFRMKLLYMVAEASKPVDRLKVLFGLEQPQDPREYRSAEDVDRFEFMSIWRTREWKHFEEKYQLRLTSFEQGAFGHARPKPTSFGHNIDGIEQLQGATMSKQRSSGESWSGLSLEERLAETAAWADLAPGLKRALVLALKNVFDSEDAAMSSTSSAEDSSSGNQEPALRPLGELALQRWRQHVLNDHQPMRRDCKVCVEAAGRSRPHKRISHAGAYTLSFDLSGRLQEGRDQWGGKKKYVMVGRYTFPTTMNDHPLIGPGQGEAPEDIPLPSMEEMGREEGIDVDFEDVELPPLEAAEVEADEPKETAEDEQSTQTARTSNESWKKLIDECKDVKVKTLTFVETLPSRHTTDVLEGISKIYARVRSLGVPVLRIHADRAREFTSKLVQKWCYDRDIIATFTSGSDWKSNGRSENEIGIIKRHAKILMKAHDIEEKAWPLLVRHASERRLRWQLTQVGYPVPMLLPFNTKVLVKRKSWNNRYGQWNRAPGKVYGPDPWSSLTSGGYVVKMEDGRFAPSTDVAVEHAEPGEPEQYPVVHEQAEQPAAAPLQDAPRRRLRFKQPEHRVAKMELDANSGERESGEQERRLEKRRLQEVHKGVTKVLSEECVLVDDMEFSHRSCVPTLAMLAHQKYDLECQLQSLEVQECREREEENFLVTKTITTEQVYREWQDWTEAMKSEYNSIVEEKKAVKQVNRSQLKKEAEEKGMKFEELPSKVVFTRKAGGKRKVRACICGNYEEEIATETYAGGCDAAQIRSVIRHSALKRWCIFGTDIRCAFLNAKRKDTTKVIAMTIPAIYVRLGLATASDVWQVDGAMYGLTTSPRDWGDHRDQTIPLINWQREEEETIAPGGHVDVKEGSDCGTCPSDRCYPMSLKSGSFTRARRTWCGAFVAAEDQHLWHLKETCQETGEVVNRGIMAIYVDDVLLGAEEKVGEKALEAIAKKWECAPASKATEQSPVTFCGFEIQANEAEHGGGFRLHQHSYEEELLKKWQVKGRALQIHYKLPLPEEEADMTKSEDGELIKKAQSITGDRARNESSGILEKTNERPCVCTRCWTRTRSTRSAF